MKGEERLVPRACELKALRAFVAAGGYKGAARKLGVSHHTIKNHLVALRQRLRARDTTHAVTIALARGYLRLEDLPLE